MPETPGKFTWEDGDIVFIKKVNLPDLAKNKEPKKEGWCYPTEKNDIIPGKKD